MSFFYVLGIISVLFFVLLFIKSFFRLNNFCVICGSVSLTWILLLILYWSGYFKNTLIIALLAGQSILGLFYLFEKKLEMFRLPFLLTLTFFGYSLFGVYDGIKESVIFLLILWLLFFVLYYYQDKNMKSFVKKIIECCRNW
ncbi:hypothetical protein J4449_01615 [Candidatus Woesearchaeota archaeon]|nr:hypothetical protein [Candidatus Woesearchaeota archaeon]